MPQVSVIVSTYNSSRTLTCALRTLCRQSFTDFEAWIVGDACTDDSEQAVAACADPRLHWFNLPQRVGYQSGPNNEGLRRAQGNYIAYLGHDDLWFPWHLDHLVATIQTGADFVHSAAALVSPQGIVQAYGAPEARRSYANRGVTPSSWLHRRQIVEISGFWPPAEHQFTNIDALFQRRAFLAGAHFASTAGLSVIKFPSPWWRTYALPEGQHPQLAYLARMEHDPRELYEQVLTELVFLYTRRDEEMPVLPSLVTALWAIRRCIKDTYGPHRWPLSHYLRWRQKRWRNLAPALRGLAPSGTDTPFADLRASPGHIP